MTSILPVNTWPGQKTSTSRGGKIRDAQSRRKRFPTFPSYLLPIVWGFMLTFFLVDTGFKNRNLASEPGHLIRSRRKRHGGTESQKEEGSQEESHEEEGGQEGPLCRQDQGWQEMQTHGVAAIQNVPPSQEAEIIRHHSLKVMGQLVQLSLFFWHQGRSATPQLERHPKIVSLLSNRMLLSVQEIRTDRGAKTLGCRRGA